MNQHTSQLNTLLYPYEPALPNHHSHYIPAFQGTGEHSKNEKIESRVEQRIALSKAQNRAENGIFSGAEESIE